GWHNYRCLARLEQARAGLQTLFDEREAAELVSLGAWAARTSDGSLADLADEPGAEVWDAVAAESDLCTRLKCPHFERCFVFQARRRAAEADVVVVNHHLLTSDLAVRMASDNWQEAAVLPPYRRLVLDEAHHLEDVAATHLGAQVSMVGVNRLLSRLERSGRGLLPTLEILLRGRDDLLSAASRDLVEQGLRDALNAARRAAEEVFAQLGRRLDREQGAPSVLRLGDEFGGDAIWAEGLGDGPHGGAAPAAGRGGGGALARAARQEDPQRLRRRGAARPRAAAQGEPVRPRRDRDPDERHARGRGRVRLSRGAAGARPAAV